MRTNAQPVDDRPWAIYARLSRVQARAAGKRQRREDETVERQQRDLKAYAEQRGLRVSELHVYVDNNRSAWKAKGGKRPAWNQMMKAGLAGDLAGVLVWKLDRFTRAPRDMEDLIDLAEVHRVNVDGPKSGHIDLSTAAGRQQARGAANQAAAESDNTSERARAALADLAAQGYQIGGSRRYGFTSTSDHDHDPAEVAILRELASRMLAGVTLQDLAKELNRRQVPTSTGEVGTWTGANLGRMLGREYYGGHAMLKGERVGKLPGEPIFDADTFAGVQAMLSARRRGRRLTGLYPLTGLIRCGRCNDGRTLSGTNGSVKRADGSQPREYRCMPQVGGCCLAVKADPVEAMVRAKVLTMLADPSVTQAVSKRDAALNEARARLLAEVDFVDDQLAQLERKKGLDFREGGMRPKQYDSAVATWSERLTKALDALDQLGELVAQGPLVRATDDDTPEAQAIDPTDWDDASLDQKRGLIRQLGVEVTVLPSSDFPGAIRNRFNPDRVQVLPEG